jgi:hypothetical protein
MDIVEINFQNGMVPVSSDEMIVTQLKIRPPVPQRKILAKSR